LQRWTIEVIDVLVRHQNQVGLTQGFHADGCLPRPILTLGEERIDKNCRPAPRIAQPKPRLPEPPQLEATHD
jgi:hypothetical protein